MLYSHSHMWIYIQILKFRFFSVKATISCCVSRAEDIGRDAVQERRAWKGERETETMADELLCDLDFCSVYTGTSTRRVPPEIGPPH